MKGQSEQDIEKIKLEFENHLLDWPDITSKKMFGHNCYQTNRKLIAFIETKGIVITKLSQTERESIPKKYNTAHYQSGNRNTKHCIRFPVKNLEDINNIIPYVRKSYESTYSRK